MFLLKNEFFHSPTKFHIEGIMRPATYFVPIVGFKDKINWPYSHIIIVYTYCSHKRVPGPVGVCPPLHGSGYRLHMLLQPRVPGFRQGQAPLHRRGRVPRQPLRTGLQVNQPKLFSHPNTEIPTSG